MNQNIGIAPTVHITQNSTASRVDSHGPACPAVTPRRGSVSAVASGCQIMAITSATRPRPIR